MKNQRNSQQKNINNLQQDVKHQQFNSIYNTGDGLRARDAVPGHGEVADVPAPSAY